MRIATWNVNSVKQRVPRLLPWLEQRRRFGRLTAADEALRERRLAFHLGAEPPKVTRCIADPLARR